MKEPRGFVSRLRSVLLIAVGVALTPAPAYAETINFGNGSSVGTALPSDLATILQEIEQGILGQYTGGGINLGGKCKPQLGFSFMALKLTFTQSATCKLDGAITFNFFPPTVDVNLNVFGSPNVQTVAFTAHIILQRDAGGLKVGFQFFDGSLGMKLGGSFANYVLNGQVYVVLGKASSFNSRKNIFDSVTRNGMALVTQVTQTPKAASIQACQLSGGDPNNVTAGTLTACTDLLKK